MKRTNNSDCIIGGVCGGVARELNIDPLWIRVGLCIATFTSCGFPGGLIYIACWMLMDGE